jgi:hypothetical protein
MYDRLAKVGISVDFSNYEKIYDIYVDKFGKDDTVRMYEEINQSLSECPIMTD